jgi:hypothetical protein
MRIAASLLAILVLSGCVSSNEFEIYRVVEFPSLFGTTVTKVETWDRVRGWTTGGRIVASETIGHPSIATAIAGPAALIYAADDLGEEIQVEANATNDNRRGKNDGGSNRWRRPRR